MQLPFTANPPRRLRLEGGVIIFTRIASQLYDLSLLSRGGECHFLGRIEQKSDALKDSLRSHAVLGVSPMSDCIKKRPPLDGDLYELSILSA